MGWKEVMGLTLSTLFVGTQKHDNAPSVIYSLYATSIIRGFLRNSRRTMLLWHTLSPFALWLTNVIISIYLNDFLKQLISTARRYYNIFTTALAAVCDMFGSSQALMCHYR
ncbi:hypothetical protein ACJX0J_011708, partial [Zea mays]